MAGFIEAERTASYETVVTWANTARHLWRMACREDGIDMRASVVVFSEGNQLVPFYQRALRQYREALSGAACFGYAGMEIVDGKAQLASFKKPKMARR